jgi:hypothetical protein
MMFSSSPLSLLLNNFSCENAMEFSVFLSLRHFFEFLWQSFLFGSVCRFALSRGKCRSSLEYTKNDILGIWKVNSILGNKNNEGEEGCMDNGEVSKITPYEIDIIN